MNNNNDDFLEFIDVAKEDLSQNTDKSSTSNMVNYENNVKKSKKSNSVTKGDIIRYAVIAIALGVFIFAAIQLIGIYANYAKGNKEYKKVQDKVFVSVEDSTIEVLANQDIVNEVVKKNDEYQFLPYNHAELLAISANAQGYLDIPSIDLKVPIAQCSDNDYYIDHAITDAYHSYGCPFVDYRIEGGIKAPNPLIYGHSMKNGAMFGMLTKYLTPSFYKQKGNQYMYLYCEEGVYIYEIFAIFITDAFDEKVYKFSYSSTEEFNNYVVNNRYRSYFDTGVDVSNAKHIITLSTCYDEKTARLIVMAKRLE